MQHFPLKYYEPIDYNFYDYSKNVFDFADEQEIKNIYQASLAALPSTPAAVYHAGDQLNDLSDFPYTPLPADPRFGMPAKTSEDALPSFLRGKEIGQDFLGINHTSTAIVSDMALRALDRILSDTSNKPFLLSVHYNAPVRSVQPRRRSE